MPLIHTVFRHLFGILKVDFVDFLELKLINISVIKYNLKRVFYYFNMIFTFELNNNIFDYMSE